MSDINQDLLGLLTKVASVLTQHNCPAYVVGGFVRDWLLNRQTADVDIAVCGDALSMAQEVAEAVDGRYVLLDEANGVARVVVADEQMRHLDFSSFLDAIQNDLARRDFTIDAMAVELQGLISGSAQLIDPFSGESDLKKRLVRAVSRRVFMEDGARLLRSVRLAAELGFKIERAASPLGPFTQIATVGSGVTAYSNSGLARFTAYSYRVRAYSTAGNSGYSNIASATTLR